MQSRAGCELIYECHQPTPMILMLNIHCSRASDIVMPDRLVTVPSLPISAYRDSFRNWCSRIVAPAGETRITAEALINDSGFPDVVAAGATQTPVEALPEETCGAKGLPRPPGICSGPDLSATAVAASRSLIGRAWKRPFASATQGSRRNSIACSRTFLGAILLSDTLAFRPTCCGPASPGQVQSVR